MKVMTVVGTRPEIIRLSLIIPKLDRVCDHKLVHTGQNFDSNLSDIFFSDLSVRSPDHFLGVRGDSFGEQLANLFIAVERVMLAERPDRLLLLGDTNSALSAVVAKRLRIPVYHMEAGNRCYDDRVPEEVNRRIIDHCSDILMPYTERSRANLIREGIEGERIFVTGNPIYEVIQHNEEEIKKSDILNRLGLSHKKYFLLTMHRAENVDVESRLRSLVQALKALRDEFDLPVICSTHPRTRSRMQDFGINDRADTNLQFHSPFGFFDFIALEQNAFCVLSDSGTVQEECAIFKVPNVTIRDVTERPETIECGSNILSGVEPSTILNCARTVTSTPCDWNPPAEYLLTDVSTTAVKIAVGFGPVAGSAGIDS